MAKIGFTTTIPVEVIYAAGKIPIDLNNIFIGHSQPQGMLERAERRGFPRNCCAWIKGIYSSLIEQQDIECIIGVVEGDCSNTRALLEVLEVEGIRYIPFSYPVSRDIKRIKTEIDRLIHLFGQDTGSVNRMKDRLDRIREKVGYLDRLTYIDNRITGFENHLWQVSCSDFEGDYTAFEKKLDGFIRTAEAREQMPQQVRLGYIGVPPIFPALYSFVEDCGARVVYNEVQRQFTMVPALGRDIYETYRQFTYPYSLETRLEDIQEAIKERRLDGILHYTQAFCFRGIEDIVIKERLGVPVLMVEGDRPGELDARTKLRAEAFIEMLKDRK
jgi:benzoyl-CoA reductase/2-hydroxyglutaryl-CoA dehydratase subunit BcrC/BadD/HgdB